MENEPLLVYTNFEGSLIIEQLRPNTSYSIFLKSFNAHGPSVTSNTVNVTTLPIGRLLFPDFLCAMSVARVKLVSCQKMSYFIFSVLGKSNITSGFNLVAICSKF